MENCVHRGDIYWVDYPQDSVGSEMKKRRPAVIVSNDKNNLFSSNIEICYLTTAEKKTLPTHVGIIVNGVRNTVLCENVYTICKDRLGIYMTSLEPAEMDLIDKALLISLCLNQDSKAEKAIENEPRQWTSPEIVSKKAFDECEKRCIELQAQNQLYRQLLSSFVPNFGGTAPC